MNNSDMNRHARYEARQIVASYPVELDEEDLANLIAMSQSTQPNYRLPRLSTGPLARALKLPSIQPTLLDERIPSTYGAFMHRPYADIPYKLPPPLPPPRWINSISSLASDPPSGHLQPQASESQTPPHLSNRTELPHSEVFGDIYGRGLLAHPLPKQWDNPVSAPFPLPGHSHAQDCKSKLEQTRPLTGRSKRTEDGDDDASGEDPIPVRVSRIKARVTELINNIESSNGPQPSPKIPPLAITAAAPFTDSAYGSASVTTGGGIPKNDDVGTGQLPQRLTERADDDMATEYSENSSTASSKKQMYISELAHDLFIKVGPIDVEQISKAELSTTLPQLLQAFALKLGYQAPSQMHRDMMAFVHKYRSIKRILTLWDMMSCKFAQRTNTSQFLREITLAFIALCTSGNDDKEEERTDKTASMSLQERMDLWKKSDQTEQIQVEEDHENLELQEEVEEEEVNGEMEAWLAAYREFAPSTDAYSWLQIQLQREFNFTTGLSAIRAIRDRILSSMPYPTRVSKNVSARSYSARFELDWNPFEFFRTQAYSSPPDQVLSKVITITGMSCDAQAMTSAEYLNQTWPTTGNSMIQLLQEVLQGDQDHMQLRRRPYVSETYRGILPDGTTLNAWISDSQFIVQVMGAGASISETGEQLAWLGAALRASSRKQGLMYCTPVVNNIYKIRPTGQDLRLEVSQDSGLEVSQDVGLELLGDIVCEIGFIMEPVPSPRQFSNGHCWHNMFRNAILVRGYPIKSRTEQNTGLDIPLHLMAGLARAQRVDCFKDKVDIKGFSAMLIPTKKSPVRHVLGWCSEARFYAGSAQAHYNVTHSELPKVHAECALFGTIVSLGKMIMGGSSFELGIKDTPVHVTRNGYIPRLKWISSKFVLLWDQQDKRGWLVNGTSALLHIVRASLTYDSTDKFRSVFLFKDTDLKESPKPLTPDSAIHVLIHSRNLGLKLYAGDDDNIVFKDRVDQIYSLLEKMFDHQTDIARHGLGKLANQPRKFLEGWDFHDLATNRDPLYPRVATLETAGKGWVDLTRALNTVTLAGRGFGGLIQPMGSDHYRPWATLPKQRYLIAGCGSELEGIGQLTDKEQSYAAEDVAERDSGLDPSLSSSGSESRAPSFLTSTTSSSMTSMGDLAPPGLESRKYTRNQYTVGILCALPIELKAVRALFDVKHPSLPNSLSDDNQYALGHMAQHMVVAASLPAGEYGTNAAASAICDMMRSFTCLQFCLLVGIAGGVPSEENDIRLGDVVVSLPTKTFPGVIQYDLGKENEGSQFELTGVLQRPPRVLTNAISKLCSDPDSNANSLDPHLTKIIDCLPTYGSPGQELDVLFQTTCLRRTCTGNCTNTQQRLPRLTAEPKIHYGLVASGNRVVKNAVLRDQLEQDYGMLCFEMEAAGVMNRANCLVIRGICDYCDARKNKVWQNYAAATAAAYAKLLLGAVAVSDDISGKTERDNNEPMPKRRRVEVD
ncbi:nucleoside phosphorylase [Fusarium heterosporum]|uniref:Nucleoside phosphorylase n=1 Tax=Fusarium heterosporum TaxID=42747 RepID=A0A8H5TYQ4_FUSHE|nr:nucleoside phosphorylase [Fusarium heterosporum]